MLTLHALSCALALMLVVSMPGAQPAPAGEPTVAAEGLTATLEISKLGSDSANSIPIDFSTANVENAQPYASTEVDTEAELAPTSLPMTSEEIALAEVAAVVAELTTATAAEMKAQEQASVEEEERQVRRRAEEARRQAIEREIARAAEMLQDEKDSGAATTLATSFSDLIGTTITATQPTTADPTTTDSPAILNELVRAAAAANEILAAALNAATMAGTNMTITTAAATTTTTTTKPDLATDTEAAIGDGLLAVSDSETLPEGEVTWQPSEIETKSTATTTKATVNIETADAATTTQITGIASDTTHSEPTPNANISNEINDDNFLVKSLESEGWRESVANSPREIVTTTTLVTEDTTGALETQSNTKTVSTLDSAPLLEHFNKNPGSEEIKQSMESADNEGAESKKVITTKEAEDATETTETTPPTAENEVEGETKDLPLAGLAATDEHLVPETATSFASSDEAAQKAISDKDEVIHSSTSEPSPVENSIKAAEFETAKIEEQKLASLREESNQPNAVENENTTTPNSREDISPDTTEPLETLIAVESEARTPNKYIKAQEEEVGAETAAKTNAMPEALTTNEEEAAQAAADTITTTVASALAEEKIAAESTTSPEVAVTTITPEDTSTKAGVEENVAKESEKEIESDPRAILSTSTITNIDDETTAAISNNDALLTKTTNKTTTEAILAEKELTEDEIIDIQDRLAKTTEAITKYEEAVKTWTGMTEATANLEATAPVTQPTLKHIEELVQETIIPATESDNSATDIPLAAFATTTGTSEELLHAEATITNDDFDKISAIGSTEQVREPTTLSSQAAENTPAEHTDLPTTSALESESVISGTTTATIGVELPQSTTAATLTIAAAAEAGVVAATTTKIEAETETEMRALTEQPQAELGATTEAALAEQPLYSRTLNAQRREVSENGSATELTSVVSDAAAAEATTATAPEVGTTTEATIITTTTASTVATNATAESTSAEATTNASEQDTTTTTKIAQPEITTTTTTREPETTTTSTTTLSPMSLIIAEHEARSLERTPPRVSRIVSDDGVEVLSGYSIVHHMHAAAMAALAAAVA